MRNSDFGVFDASPNTEFLRIIDNSRDFAIDSDMNKCFEGQLMQEVLRCTGKRNDLDFNIQGLRPENWPVFGLYYSVSIDYDS